MRIVSIIQAATLLLVVAVPVAEAQAKGRRAFGGVWTAAHAPVPIRTTIPVEASKGGPVPVLALGGVPLPEGKTVPENKTVVENKTVPETKPVIREAAAAASWCGKGRVFGSGAGFCEIN